MKRLIAGVAFLTSVIAWLVIAGIGLMALAIESSGERATGALLAIGGSVALAATMMLVFARKGAFAGRSGWISALTAALLGALPVGALGVAILIFSGFPLGSAVPLFDWSIFALGIVSVLGAASILMLGYGRMSESQSAHVRPAERAEHAPAAAARASPQRRRAPETEPPEGRQRGEEEDDVRVTPIELPSIGRFRR